MKNFFVFVLVIMVLSVTGVSCNKCQHCEVYYLGTTITSSAEYCDEELDQLKATYTWNETTQSGVKCN